MTIESQSGITVPARRWKTPAPRRGSDENGPIICDGSVPYQDPPLADEEPLADPARPGGLAERHPGQLLALTPTSAYSRRLRHYLGVVAESVFAADGPIRLRRRTTDLPAAQVGSDSSTAPAPPRT